MTRGLSVVVPTRNRDAHITQCVASILATSGFDELIVVDQSDGSATEAALADFQDPRLRHVRTDTRGVTLARNLGIDLSHNELVAFTDDDCRVTANWASTLTALFGADPEAAVVCGRVRVPDNLLQDGGYTAYFEPEIREWRGRYPPPHSDWGITANLALRRTVVACVGNFDPMLGAGAPLRSGGEPDFIFRVLRAGLKIVNAREVIVDHLGVRPPGRETQQLIYGYASGMGAAFYKHVRLGDLQGIAVYLRFLGSGVQMIGQNVLHGRRPLGSSFLRGFVSGSLQSYKFGIDPDSRHYVSR
jgi:glycosyltransferase involved in cell wall biosynthesis